MADALSNCSNISNANEEIIIAAESFLRNLFGIYPLPFILLALVVLLFFSASVIVGLREERLSVKLYIFLLHRTAGDLLTLIALATIDILHALDILTTKDTLDAFQVCALGYWSTTTAYLSLALMKLLAVKYPMFYRRHVRVRHCLAIVALSWVFGICWTIFHGIIAIDYRTHGTFIVQVCINMDECSKMGRIYWTAFGLTTYASVVIVYVWTALIVRRSLTRSRSVTNSTVNPNQRRGNLWKTGTNIVIYAVCFALDTPGVFAIGTLSRPVFGYDECVLIDRAMFDLSEILACIWLAAFLLRIIADPIANIVTDPSLRFIAIRVFCK
uniref:G-protein coupled receptors family 1 profile domain-containing protein n=1 Tax=Plectus sambesii TaxID=2011161 RepID=A0A914V1H1_9BILA